MTMFAPVCRCRLLPRVAAAPPPVWLAWHLALYAALDVSTMAVLATAAGGSVVTGVATTIAWTLPLHVAILGLAAGALSFLRTVRELRRCWFRLSALAVLVTPAAAVAWVLSSGDIGVVLRVLPWHILTALLVVRPDAGWPATTE